MDKHNGGDGSAARKKDTVKTRRQKAAAKLYRGLRPVLIALISLGICAAMIAAGYRFVKARFLDPVDIDDATPVTVTISSGSGASLIAKKLYEAGGVDDDGALISPGLIASKTVFKIYVDFTGKSSKLKAGTYVLSRNMDVTQIVDVICEGNAPRTTLKFTVTEGMTVEQIAAKLVSLGVLDDAKLFTQLCVTGEEFSDYAFIDALKDEADPEQARTYALEGYLFPDTYEIYSDESAKSIISRLLNRFSTIYSDDFIARAQQLDMSTDEVMTLASLIEKEAKLEEDFTRVSAVFSLRLSQGMKLQSDAPLKYIYKTGNDITFTDAQKNDPSKYNTHVHEGLPLGPICNPGVRAIKAALYPDEQMYEDGYLYFCLTDHDSGALIYAKTYEEHQRNVEMYRPLW